MSGWRFSQAVPYSTATRMQALHPRPPTCQLNSRCRPLWKSTAADTIVVGHNLNWYGTWPPRSTPKWMRQHQSHPSELRREGWEPIAALISDRSISNTRQLSPGARRNCSPSAPGLCGGSHIRSRRRSLDRTITTPAATSPPRSCRTRRGQALRSCGAPISGDWLRDVLPSDPARRAHHIPLSGADDEIRIACGCDRVTMRLDRCANLFFPVIREYQPYILAHRLKAEACPKLDEPLPRLPIEGPVSLAPGDVHPGLDCDHLGYQDPSKMAAIPRDAQSLRIWAKNRIPPPP